MSSKKTISPTSKKPILADAQVLIFCPYYPPHRGGLESHAAEFNAHLKKHVRGITVFTPRLPVNAAEEETDKNLTIIRFPAIEVVPNFFLPKIWSRKYHVLKKRVYQQEYSLVISRTRFFYTSLMALLFFRRRRIRWIHIEHGSGFVTLSSPISTAIARIYDETLGRLVFKCSTKNISISRAVSAFVLKFDKRPTPIIYRGIDMEEIDNISPDTELTKNYEGKIIVLSASRLFKWKGTSTVVEAVNSLPSEIQNKIVYLVVGNGEDLFSLTALARPPVVMVGGLPRTKVMAIMKKADIFIHSSLPGGGLSASLLEAMYCGCSIIATPNEGANEVITDHSTGLMIGAGSPTELASAIINLVKNTSLRKELAKQAHLLIKEKFSWDTAMNLYLEKLTK